MSFLLIFSQKACVIIFCCCRRPDPIISFINKLIIKKREIPLSLKNDLVFPFSIDQKLLIIPTYVPKNFGIGVLKVFRLSFQILSKALQTQALAALVQISNLNNHATSLFLVLQVLFSIFCIIAYILHLFMNQCFKSILRPNQQGPKQQKVSARS